MGQQVRIRQEIPGECRYSVLAKTGCAPGYAEEKKRRAVTRLADTTPSTTRPGTPLNRPMTGARRQSATTRPAVRHRPTYPSPSPRTTRQPDHQTTRPKGPTRRCRAAAARHRHSTMRLMNQDWKSGSLRPGPARTSRWPVRAGCSPGRPAGWGAWAPSRASAGCTRWTRAGRSRRSARGGRRSPPVPTPPAGPAAGR